MSSITTAFENFRCHNCGKEILNSIIYYDGEYYCSETCANRLPTGWVCPKCDTCINPEEKICPTCSRKTSNGIIGWEKIDKWIPPSQTNL